MCGIIGITGRDDAVDGILAGLTRLEYRGYDSAGVVVRDGDELLVTKRAGKLDNLKSALADEPTSGRVGIGHTRWATHGAPNDANAHPHLGPTGRVAVVHNGILENYQALRAELDGATFASDTDSEVAAHLVERELDAMDTPDLFEAVRRTVARLEGAYSLCFVALDDPDTIVVAKFEAPLIVAAADGVGYCASDVAALIEHTKDVAALLDGQLARITPDGVEVRDLAGNPAEPHRYTVDWDLSAAEKQGYDTFMLKEIHEQPRAVADTLLGRFDEGRLHLDELQTDEREFGRVDKVFVLACGTSRYAGMVAKYAIEHWAGIPCEVEEASEFRYRDPILDPHTLVIAISQSGETTDTIAAALHARDQRAPVIALCNIVGSTLAREADGVLYTHAGLEVAVASTKAFTTQIVGGLLLALYLAQQRGRMYGSEIEDILGRLQQIPSALEQVLELDGEIRQLAEQYQAVPYTMFIGRHVGLPIAYEGALKLKEISYLHAEAFAAGEMKHGPIALIEDGSLVVALAAAGHVFGKMVSNIQEVRARGASVLAIGTEGSTADLKANADHVLTLPEAPHELAGPILSVVPLQLFAYHIATLRGEDVDQPRNLAKTVTVE
ncbi:glutamine--fructose-6-phosphate transaminase (isomerizing) [Egicoccus halophilus]|uniref:Glutamine--fructose-6-phosphate aminotransferase [isomerizing] n=1 Tax=Egicoccus halophilus TaxID=1670830 RepID=A0A8J3AA59_9ACTN|nr:glutamine--fructose-6-phosphate transaminase (isomerizing) [Egicoccus halophilus]GGI05895.1 glutamine--fructose-6-phosphate aminotransferase [isomerizing] [Egicoccus halophilus]